MAAQRRAEDLEQARLVTKPPEAEDTQGAEPA